MGKASRPATNRTWALSGPPLEPATDTDTVTPAAIIVTGRVKLGDLFLCNLSDLTDYNGNPLDMSDMDGLTVRQFLALAERKLGGGSIGSTDSFAGIDQLTAAIRSIYAVAESYPQLRASEQFTSLQTSLNTVEDTIQNARRYYNAVVRDYNTRIQSFPTNLLSGIFGFTHKQFFEPEEPADRANVAVKF